MARVSQIGEIHHDDDVGNHCKEAILKKRFAMLQMMRAQRMALEDSSLIVAVVQKKHSDARHSQFTEPVDSDEKSSVVEKLSRFAGSLSIGQGSKDPFFFSMTMYPLRATINSAPITTLLIVSVYFTDTRPGNTPAWMAQ